MRSGGVIQKGGSAVRQAGGEDRVMALEILKAECEITTGHIDPPLATCLRYDRVALLARGTS